MNLLGYIYSVQCYWEFRVFWIEIFMNSATNEHLGIGRQHSVGLRAHAWNWANTLTVC